MTQLQKLNFEIEATDKLTMQDMTADQYAEHLEQHLFFTDSHGNICATQGEYPIVCTTEQLTILINYLETKRGSLER